MCWIDCHVPARREGLGPAGVARGHVEVAVVAFLPNLAGDVGVVHLRFRVSLELYPHQPPSHLVAWKERRIGAVAEDRSMSGSEGARGGRSARSAAASGAGGGGAASVAAAEVAVATVTGVGSGSCSCTPPASHREGT